MLNAFAEIRDRVIEALNGLQAAGELPEVRLGAVSVDPPRDPAHGEASTNAALVLAKEAGVRPMELAAKLAAVLSGTPDMAAAGVAAPGFVNMTFEPAFWRRQIVSVLAIGSDYGRSEVGGGTAVNIEYCSANPTGPLHIGHGRGTVFGDALASVLEYAGWAVTREYYVNDGGAQIETLARSIHYRYRQAMGEDVGPMTEGYYPGDYLVPLGRVIAERDGGRWLEVPETAWLEAFGREGMASMLGLIKADLAALGVRHDVFTSERDLVEGGRIDEALDQLAARDLVYTGILPPPKGRVTDDWEPTPQLLLRSTAYGDDADRPLKRSGGGWAYLAPDVAYHWDKVRRGFPVLIDVLGADHAGYVKRLIAAVRALSNDEARLDVRLCQLVNMMDGGKPLKMSKRAGRIVTLRDVIDEVGKDVVRFMMLTRKNDAPLDFDLVKVTEQSKDNPVFYVQYAHARICSVFRRAEEEGWDRGVDGAALGRLDDPSELALIRIVAGFPRSVEAAAMSFEPHRIAFYLQDLAGAFHALWTRGNERPELKFIRDDDEPLTRARLAMLAAVRQVLANGLTLLGVEPVDELR